MATKIFVGNIPETCEAYEMRQLFEEHGEVVECDIVKNYGFVHFASKEEGERAQKALHNFELHGQNIRVELSTSAVRPKPGMGNKGGCYKCGKSGHWSSECPEGPATSLRRMRGRGRDDRGGGYGRGRGRGGYGGGRDYDSYRGDPYGDDPYASRDRYARYRDRYDPYARMRPDPYSRPPADFYRRPMPPPRGDYYDQYYRRPAPGRGGY